MTHMDLLENLLIASDMPYVRKTSFVGNDQICYPNNENIKCSIICGRYTYGGSKGFLEIMVLGKCNIALPYEDDNVIGWLTSAEVYNILLNLE